MEVSLIIVSKNRKDDLFQTLNIVIAKIDLSVHEILVFLDGCTDGSNKLKLNFPQVRWFESEKSIGASPARHVLYKRAKGTVFIGLDDDAHPLEDNFILKIENLFNKNPNVGILAFEEIKGIFSTNEAALKQSETKKIEFLTSEFIGCGFAIKKSVYDKTDGFPVWLDIYGEESCLSIEVLDKGYDILYTNSIKINHRVDIALRKKAGHNCFRFEKQLKNTTFYYLVYYRFPFLKIMKLYKHNFFKYAVKDFKFFKVYFSVIIEVIKNAKKILKYRKPVDDVVVKKIKSLSRIKY